MNLEERKAEKTLRTIHMKAKTVKRNWKWRTNKLALPSVFTICIFFFLSGFFASNLFYHSQELEYDLRLMPRSRARLLEKSTDYDSLPAGESGENFTTLIPFQVLSWYPRAMYFPNFASAEQCKSIIEMAREGLKPSTVLLRKGETEEDTKGIRTSSGVFISASEDKTGVLNAIEEKIAKATKIPTTHGEKMLRECKIVTCHTFAFTISPTENRIMLRDFVPRGRQETLYLKPEPFNILRYEVGQKYDAHYDVFNSAQYGPQKSQRVASFLLYLTDVSEGGETMFPFENGFNMDGSYRFEDCIGLRVRPRRGDGLLFYSLLPNGTTDPTSLHGSCPVMKGEKWVATKWIRDQELYD